MANDQRKASEELRDYYEQELTFLAQIGEEFARKYPRIADHLQLKTDTKDPHVERLIQAVAFLSARVRHKLDDEFPEITNALLSVLYPHYLAPIPSLAIAQFAPDPFQGKLTSGHLLKQGTLLYTTQSINETQCTFRTSYPVTLWPLEVTAAQFDAPDHLGPGLKAEAVLRLELRCMGDTTFAEFEKFDHLRFFLHGERSLPYVLYELLFNNVREVHLRSGQDQKSLPSFKLAWPDCLRPVGFETEEDMFPYPTRSFSGYRLLQEYFAFPQKFLFFDLYGLDRAAQAGFKERLEILFFLDRNPRLDISKEHFALGCTPIVNLFEQLTEPIALNQFHTEYRVVPDVRRQSATEVYAIEEVLSFSPDSQEPLAFQPFYSFKHAVDRIHQRTFWYASRRPSQWDDGTDVYLSFVNFDFAPSLPAGETIVIRATCTNRDLPSKLPLPTKLPLDEDKRKGRSDFSIEGAAPVVLTRYLDTPTKAVRPFQKGARRGTQWRLISHLSLNYLSLCEDGGDALREILKLYDFSDSKMIQQQIAGIVQVTSRQVVRRSPSTSWNGFCRGMEVALEFDEEQYVGAGVFLFAAVLERFLGLYASLNSFTELTVTTTQRQQRHEKALKKWPPRAGEQILL